MAAWVPVQAWARQGAARLTVRWLHKHSWKRLLIRVYLPMGFVGKEILASALSEHNLS